MSMKHTWVRFTCIFVLLDSPYILCGQIMSPVQDFGVQHLFVKWKGSVGIFGFE